MKKIILSSLLILSMNISAQNGVIGIGVNTLSELTMFADVITDNGSIVDFSMSMNLDETVTHMDGYYSPWPGDVWEGQYVEENIQIGLTYGKIVKNKYVVGGGLSYRKETDLPVYVEEYVVFSPNGLYTIDAGNNHYESVYPSIMLGVFEKNIFLRTELSVKASNITIGITI
jgi:hypothetical protein